MYNPFNVIKFVRDIWKKKSEEDKQLESADLKNWSVEEWQVSVLAFLASLC